MMNEKSKERVPGTSILKQKHKFAAEVEISGSHLECTPRANKRVSFKRVSFIKPFITDADKNTIWDTTYEEEVNHTDSTHSHQENTSQKYKQGASDDLNTTKLVPDDDEEEVISQTDYVKQCNNETLDKGTTLLCNESMEFTQPVEAFLGRPNKTLVSQISMDLTMVDKENMLIDGTLGLRNKASILTFAKRSEHCSTLLSSEPTFNHGPASIQIHSSKMGIGNTENSEDIQSYNYLQQIAPSDIDVDVIPMELSFNAQSEDMEISYCDIDTVKEKNLEFIKGNSDTGTHKDVEKVIYKHRNIDNPVAIINAIPDTSTVAQNISLKSSLVNDTSIYRNVEALVCNSVNSYKINTANSTAHTSIKYTSAALGGTTNEDDDVDMEFTCQGIRNADCNMQQERENGTNLELTCQNPGPLIGQDVQLLDNSMQFTCKITERLSIPSSIATRLTNVNRNISEENKENVSTAQIGIYNAALSEATAVGMEFTCHGFRNGLPNSQVGTQHKNVELTCQNPGPLIGQDVQLLDESMQFTCKLTETFSNPCSIATNSKDGSRKTLEENKRNVYPDDYRVKIKHGGGLNNYKSSSTPVNLNTSDTHILNESMQLTCKLPSLKITTNCTKLKSGDATIRDKENIIRPLNSQGEDNSKQQFMQCASQALRTHKIPVNRSEQSQLLEENMELFCPNATSNHSIASEIQVDNESMQLTCTFPVVSNHQRDTGVVNSHINKDNIEVDKENINPSKNIDSIVKKNRNVDNFEMVDIFSKQKGQHMCVDQSKQETDMDFTCQIPTINFNKPENIQHFNESMQFTCAFPSVNSLNEYNQRIKSNTETSKSNIEDIKLTTSTTATVLKQSEKLTEGVCMNHEEKNQLEPSYCVAKEMNVISQSDALKCCKEGNANLHKSRNAKESTCDDKVLNESMDFTCKFTTTQLPKNCRLVQQEHRKIAELDKENVNPVDSNKGNNLQTSKQSVHVNSTMVIDSECSQFQDAVLTHNRSASGLKRHHEIPYPSDINIMNDSIVSVCKLPRLEIADDTPATTIIKFQNKDEINTANKKQFTNVNFQTPILASEKENTTENIKPLLLSANFVEQSAINFPDKENHTPGEHSLTTFPLEQANIHMIEDKHAASDFSFLKNTCENVHQDAYIANSCDTANRLHQTQEKICVNDQNIDKSVQLLNDNSVSALNFTKGNISLAASYNFDLKSMSSCIDDTQKLINLTLSRPFKELSNRSSFGLHSSHVIPCQITENSVSIPRIDDSQFETSTSPYITEDIGKDTKAIRDMVPQINVANDSLGIDSLKFKCFENLSYCIPQVIAQPLSKYIVGTPNKIDVIKMKDGDSVKNHCSHIKLTEETLHLSNECFLLDSQNCSMKTFGINSRSKRGSKEFINISDESSSILVDPIDLDISSEDGDISACAPKYDYKPLNQVIRSIKLEKCCFVELQFTSNISEVLRSKGLDWLNSRFNAIKIEAIKILSFEEMYETNNDSSGSSNTSVLVETNSASTSLREIELPPKPISLLEKIHDIEKRCTPYWKFDKEVNDKYFFSTMYNTLQLVVQSTSEGVVWDIQFINNLSENAQPLSKYVHKLFIETLNSRNIESTLGIRYDILAFLDYLCLTMQTMLEFISCFEEHQMVMDPSNIVTMKIIDIDLIINWVILIDVSDLKNVTTDNISLEVKTIPYSFLHNSKDYVQRNENVLKGFVNQCPKGVKFFKEFRKHLNEYIKLLSKRTKFSSNTAGKH